MDATHTPPSTRPERRLTLSGLLLRAGSLFAATAATLLAVVGGVPDENDYALASRLKHARLAQISEPKIVFVGGSNLSYGLDSDAIERATSRPVVNMGMNGYLGVRFMLAEVEPALRPGDTVALSFEYDSFYKSIEGDPASLLMIVKAQPGLFAALTPAQAGAVIAHIPFVAQQKVFRLIRSALPGGLSRRPSPDDIEDGLTSSLEYASLMNRIESLGGFDDHGDLNSHVDVQWPFRRSEGYDLTHLTPDEHVLPLIDDFARRARRRDIQVVLHYGPVAESFYRKHQASIEQLHRELAALGSLQVTGTPRDTVFPDESFFDTVYHLTNEGRQVRSARVAAALRSVLHLGPSSSARHSADNHATNHDD